MSDEAHDLAIESWTLYAITIIIIGARIASRRILLGSLKKLQIDDYIMLFVTITYTVVIISINQTANNLSSYLPPGVVQTLTPDEIQNAIYGSKFVFVTENFKLATIWMCKACLLILYSHMTLGLPKQHRLVKVVGGYCVLGYVVVMVCFLAVWCRPIQQYWAVPPQNSQCASYYHHLITDAVFNISSDLMMLFLPLPLLIKAKLPLKRKLVLSAVFSLGVFVILCAVLNRYYNFTAGYGSLIYLNWYAGETSTAIIVANIPHCWPLLSRVFHLGSFKSSTNDPNSASRLKFASVTSQNRRRPNGLDTEGYLRSESEERIASKGAGAWTMQSQSHDVELGNVEGNPYSATATGGDDKSEDIWTTKRDEKSDGIVRTVHIRQYSN